MIHEFQPELITGTYPTGRYTVQLNARANYYHENMTHRAHAEKIIAQIEALTKGEWPDMRMFGPTTWHYGEFKYKPTARKKRPIKWSATAMNTAPKRAPKYIGPNLNARKETLAITETLGGEPWPRARARMEAVAVAIGWRYGGAVPGDYIPQTLEEARDFWATRRTAAA